MGPELAGSMVKQGWVVDKMLNGEGYIQDASQGKNLVGTTH